MPLPRLSSSYLHLTLAAGSLWFGCVQPEPTWGRRTLVGNKAPIERASRPASSDRRRDPPPPRGATRRTRREIGGGPCNLGKLFVHKTRNDGERGILHGRGAVVYRARYATNTDGAPSSYHPDDPWGSKGLAVNTICNGADAYTASGEKVDYRQCKRLIGLYKRAQAAGWVKQRNTPYMRFYGVATQDWNQRVPCVIREGRYAGYFVSTTTWRAPGRDPCEPSRYLDALTIPFIVVPNDQKFRRLGMGMGDVAVVYAPKTDTLVYAVVGDLGPAEGLGEGSIAISMELTDTRELPERRADIKAYRLPEVVTLVLTERVISDPRSRRDIERTARRAFEQFGGLRRLQACAAELEKPRYVLE